MVSESLTCLRSVRWMRNVDEVAVAELAQHARMRSFAQGERIFMAGEPAANFTFIRRGLVQIVRTMAGGTEATLGLFGPRESVGDTAALGREAYPGSAIAASAAVEVALVPEERMREVMGRVPSLASAMNGALLEHTRVLRTKIDILSAGSIPARLATLLLHLAERFGDETENGELWVPVALSRSDLAIVVSARTETVIRVMSRWQKLGWVRTDADGFALVTPGLLESTASGL